MSGQNGGVNPNSTSGHEPLQELRPMRPARLAWLPIPLLAAGHHRWKGGGPLRILQVRNPHTRLELHLLHAGLAGHPLSHRTELPGLRHAGAAAAGVRGGSVEFGRHGGGRRLPRQCEHQCHHLQYRHLCWRDCAIWRAPSSPCGRSGRFALRACGWGRVSRSP